MISLAEPKSTIKLQDLQKDIPGAIFGARITKGKFGESILLEFKGEEGVRKFQLAARFEIKEV